MKNNKAAKHIILCVTNDLSQDQRMHKTAITLVKLGFDVTLVGRTLPYSLELENLDYTQTRLKCWFHNGPLFYLEFNIRLFFFLFFRKFDFVTACDLDTIIGVYFAGRINRAILIFDAHEYFSEVPELKGKRAIKFIWKLIEKIFVPNMDKRYTVNNSLAKIFHKNLKVKFDVVENWPSPQSVPFVNESNPNHRLLYQGVLNQGRGLKNMIKVMKYFPAMEFWIIGRGILGNELLHLINDYELSARVKLIGFVSPKNLHDYSNKATIGVNLLVSDSLNYYYSSANKFFDYIQAGLPSINMNFPEYRRINELYEVSLLIDDIEVISLKNAIESIIEESTYLRLADNCKIAKDDFVWNRNEGILIDIYK